MPISIVHICNTARCAAHFADKCNRFDFPFKAIFVLFLLSRCQIDLGHTVHDFRQRCPNQGSKSLSCSLLILFRATACGIFALSEVCNEICRI